MKANVCRKCGQEPHVKQIEGMYYTICKGGKKYKSCWNPHEFLGLTQRASIEAWNFMNLPKTVCYKVKNRMSNNALNVDVVLKHLKKYGSIDKDEALNLYKIKALGTSIYRLREFYTIICDKDKKPARYNLIGE